MNSQLLLKKFPRKSKTNAFKSFNSLLAEVSHDEGFLEIETVMLL